MTSNNLINIFCRIFASFFFFFTNLSVNAMQNPHDMDIEQPPQPQGEYVVGVVRSRVVIECPDNNEQNRPIGLVENIFNPQGPDGFVNRYTHGFDNGNFIYRRINPNQTIENQIPNSTYQIIFGIWCNNGESVADALRRVVKEIFNNNPMARLYHSGFELGAQINNAIHQNILNNPASHAEPKFLREIVLGNITPTVGNQENVFFSKFFGISKWEFCGNCTRMIVKVLLNQNGILNNVNQNQPNRRPMPIEAVFISNSLLQTDRDYVKINNFFIQVYGSNGLIPENVELSLLDMNYVNGNLDNPRSIQLVNRARYYMDGTNLHPNPLVRQDNWFNVFY